MNRTPIVAVAIVCALTVFGGWRLVQGRQQDRAAEQRLANEFAAALGGHQHVKAIELGLRLVEMSPQNATHAYNLGCAYAKSNDADNASKWLQTAADRGFYFLATMQRDEDLAPIRDTEGFKKALVSVKANSDRELEAFKKQHMDDQPIIVLPPEHDSSKPAPLIVALHPTGGNAKDFDNVWRESAAAAGAILVVPEGKLAVGDGWRWGKVEHGEWQAVRAIEIAKAKHNIDPKRVVVTGFSEGGSVSFVVALRNPPAITAAIPMCGEFVPQVSPIVKLADGAKSPRLYIITGDHDRDVETNRQASKELEAAGWTFKLREFEGMGHSLPPNYPKQFAIALEWAFANE